MNCSKCNGTGYIQGFSHISKGVCFGCMGSGVLPESKKETIDYARAFINQFCGHGFFPNDIKAEKLYPYSFIGHPTAEGQVLTDSSYYYVGQPICRSSVWWKVPISEWSRFKAFYNRISKREVLK